jgi:hypothetical protein
MLACVTWGPSAIRSSSWLLPRGRRLSQGVTRFDNLDEPQLRNLTADREIHLASLFIGRVSIRFCPLSPGGDSKALSLAEKRKAASRLNSHVFNEPLRLQKENDSYFARISITLLSSEKSLAICTKIGSNEGEVVQNSHFCRATTPNHVNFQSW